MKLKNCKMANRRQKVILKFKDDAFVEQLSSLLLKTGKVKVGGLGIFEIRDVSEREGYNVHNGDRIVIPAHKKVAFIPTKKLKETIQEYGKND